MPECRHAHPRSQPFLEPALRAQSGEPRRLRPAGQAREGERTRDKIAATRRKGRWSGGVPILGYSVVGKKLVVDRAEAEQVRRNFELNRRGWSTKQWTTKKGKPVGGLAFNRTNLHFLLTNVLYVGKVRYKDEVHDGLHEAIVQTDLFNRVQQLLTRNGWGTSRGPG